MKFNNKCAKTSIIVLIFLSVVNLSLAIVNDSAQCPNFFQSGTKGGRGCWVYPDVKRKLKPIHDVQTIHIPWLKTYKVPPVKILAIASRSLGRWPLELKQRMPLKLKTIYFESKKNPNASRGSIAQNKIDAEADLLAALNDKYDVIVSEIPFNKFSKKTQKRLLGKINQHCGFIGNLKGFNLKDLNPKPKVATQILESYFSISSTKQTKQNIPLPIYENTKNQSRIADVWKIPLDDSRNTILCFRNLPDMALENWMLIFIKTINWVNKRHYQSEDFCVTVKDKELGFKAPVYSILSLKLWDTSGRIRLVYNAKSSQKSAKVDLSNLPGGNYLAECKAVASGKLVGWKVFTLPVRKTFNIKILNVLSPPTKKNDLLKIELELTDTPPVGCKTILKTLDNWGRILYKSNNNAQRKKTYQLKSTNSLSSYNYVMAIVYDSDGKPVAEKITSFIIPPKVLPKDESNFLMWGGGNLANPRIRLLYRKHQADGVDLILTGAGKKNDTNIRPYSQFNFRSLIWACSVRNPKVENGVRQPSLASSQYNKTMKNKLTTLAKRKAKYMPLYSLGDDQNYLNFGQDAGWSKEGRKLLAQWSQKHYFDIKKLNQAWQTKFKTFSDVLPIKLSDAINQVYKNNLFGSFCCWVDHQIQQQQLVTNWHEIMRNAIDKTVPGSMTGLGGTVQWPCPGTGFNYWNLARKLDLVITYPHPITLDLYRSAGGKAVIKGLWYGGYGVYNRKPYWVMNSYPWMALFNGVNLHCLWHGGEQGGWNYGRVIAPDLGPLYGYKKVLKSIKEQKSGIAKALLNAKCLDDGIAFIWSSRSLEASAITVPLPNSKKTKNMGLFSSSGKSIGNTVTPFPKNLAWKGLYYGADRYIYMQCWEGMSKLIKDLGFSYTVLNEDEISLKILREKKIKLLVLPYLINGKNTTAKVIRKFVKEGGCVIADFGTGAFSENMRPASPGIFSDTLGIKYNGNLLQHKMKLETVNIDLNNFKESEIAYPSQSSQSLKQYAAWSQVKTNKGIPLGKTKTGIPVLIYNHFGKGKTLFLNVISRDYQIWRTVGMELPFRNAVGGVFKQFGLNPQNSLQVYWGKKEGYRPLQATSIYNYMLGKCRFTGVLRDAVLRGDEAVFMTDLVPRATEIDFGEKYHVYDVRNKRYRGFRRKIDQMVEPGEALLYALLPYEVSTIEYESSYQPDSKLLKVNLQIKTYNSVTPGTHVIHLDLIDPNGNLKREYSRNLIAVAGKCSTEMFLGLNAERGVWTITAKDTATSTKREFKINITTK